MDQKGSRGFYLLNYSSDCAFVPKKKIIMPHTRKNRQTHKHGKASHRRYLHHQEKEKEKEEVIASGVSAVVPALEQQLQQAQQRFLVCDQERRDNEKWAVHYFRRSIFDVGKQRDEKRELQVKVERLENKVEELKCEVERWEQEYDLVNQVVDRKTALGVQYLQEKNEKDREIFRLRGELAEAEKNLGLFTSYNNAN